VIRPRPVAGKVACVIAIASILLLVADDALARRMGGFSGGRSFSSFGSSRSVSSRSTRSVFGSSSRTATTRSSLSGTRGVSSRSNTGSVSRSQYQRSRAAGTTFQNRTQAESAFRQRNAGQFPSRYATQPSSRPNHIPQSTRVDGRNVNVTYNAGLGGYGYRHPTLGTWILYSAMTDAVMMSALMSRGGYYYGAAPGTYAGGGGGFFTGLILILLIVGVMWVLLRSSGRRF
jgi:hypothetical protein